MGVNKFTANEKHDTPLLRVDDSIRISQTEKLTQLKKERDNKAVIECLLKIEAAARGTENLMPLIVDAVEKYATLGEISDAMRKVFGEFKS